MTQTPFIDMSTTLACVPVGCIESAKKYRKKSKLAARLGELPVLAGTFSPAGSKFDASLPSNLGWGSLNASGMSLPMLTFRLQVGADMRYWLANPWDPEIWAMLDAWAAAGTMAVAAEIDDKVTIASRDYELVPSIEALRDRAQAGMKKIALIEEFMQGAGSTVISGRLAIGATTDIPGIPTLRQVQACTVETDTTGRIFVPPEIAVLAACDLLVPSPALVPLQASDTRH